MRLRPVGVEMNSKLHSSLKTIPKNSLFGSFNSEKFIGKNFSIQYNFFVGGEK
jgi:hypothetical protein